MLNIREDACNVISIEYCIRTLEIMIFLVHERYGRSFICGCNLVSYHLLGDNICNQIMHTVQSLDV